MHDKGPLVGRALEELRLSLSTLRSHSKKEELGELKHSELLCVEIATRHKLDMAVDASSLIVNQAMMYVNSKPRFWLKGQDSFTEKHLVLHSRDPLSLEVEGCGSRDYILHGFSNTDTILQLASCYRANLCTLVDPLYAGYQWVDLPYFWPAPSPV